MRNHALYVQEQWTINRLTLQGALRYDNASSWAPEQTLGPARFLPTPIHFDETPVVNSYHDITPRVAATYDLFGDGKTAIKATYGKYLESTITASNYGLGNPTSRIAQNTARNWTDVNGNWIPDCDLLNPVAQGPLTGPNVPLFAVDSCGPYANANFGTTRFSNTIDPEILKGWGVRPSDMRITVGVQQEILPRVSVDVAFVHRRFYGFTVTDNLAVTPADFTEFSVVAPRDSRLPDGGGYTINGLYDVNPNKFGATDNYITYSDNYGEQYQRFSGWDISVNARPRNGLTMQGGVSFGKSESDNCEIRAKVPEIAPVNQWCHIETGQLPQYKALGTYIVPKVDVSLSTTFTSKPGIQVSGFGTPVAGGAFAANYVYTNAQIAPSLGRNLSSGVNGNVTVNLIEPHSILGERVNEVD
jgi:hypothetical protein